MSRSRKQLRAALGPVKPMYTPQTLQIDTGKSRTAIFNAIGSGELTSVLIGHRRHIPGECDVVNIFFTTQLSNFS